MSSMMNTSAEETDCLPLSSRGSVNRVIAFHCHICLETVSEPVVTVCGHLYCWPCLYKWLEPGLLPNERGTTVGLVDESHRVCPVCKAPCTMGTIVPIYVGDEEDETPVAIASSSGQGKTRMIRKWVSSSSADLIVSDSGKALEDSSDHHTNSQSAGRTTATDRMRRRRRGRRRQQNDGDDDDYHIPERPRPKVHTLGAPSPVPRANSSSRPHNLTSQGIAGSFFVGVDHDEYSDTSAGGGHNVDLTFSAMAPRNGREEFLSRMLLLLGSFVIICLLLF